MTDGPVNLYLSGQSIAEHNEIATVFIDNRNDIF
jgi:hypothetical protein